MPFNPQALRGRNARAIVYALKHLDSPSSYAQIKSLDDLRLDTVLHEIKLADGRQGFLSRSGLEHVQNMAHALHEAGLFQGEADLDDVSRAMWKVLERLLSRKMRPESADELAALVGAELTPQIQDRTFVVPFSGIEFQGIDDLDLGGLRVVRPNIAHLDEAGVAHDFADVPKLIERHRGLLWIVGTTRGTPRIAEESFRARVDLTAGLLAMTGASMLNEGARRLHIGPSLDSRYSQDSATWFSWDNAILGLSIHQGGNFRPPLPIDAAMRDQIHSASTIATATRIIGSDARTDLEETVSRGFHWFADAHRDPVLVMQFVKYWSCVEAFFSSKENSQITRSVSTGLAAVLVFSGFGFVPPTEYAGLKRRVVQLYAKRSRAVHGASRSHITEQDVADLSKWTAWLLTAMLSFVERGYSECSAVKAASELVDAQAVGPRTGDSTKESRPLEDG
jgi:hypothetical protein